MAQNFVHATDKQHKQNSMKTRIYQQIRKHPLLLEKQLVGYDLSRTFTKPYQALLRLSTGDWCLGELFLGHCYLGMISWRFFPWVLSPGRSSPEGLFIAALSPGGGMEIFS